MGKVAGVTGVILAGGRSSRMGSDKALLPYSGGRFIESIHRLLASLFPETLVVTNRPELYPFLPCPKVPDLLPGAGPLSGIHSALSHCATPRAFIVGCDMPYLCEELIVRIAAAETPTADAVVPRWEDGLEPLHALYGTGCLSAVTAAIQAGRRRIVSFFDMVRVTEIPEEDIALLDPLGLSFRNINTPEEYFRLRGESWRRQDRAGGGMV